MNANNSFRCRHRSSDVVELMNHTRTTVSLATLVSLILLLGILSGAAQSHILDWFTMDGGGGTSAAGAYAVSGTIGQPDAGAMSGGTYSLAGGFWGGITGGVLEPVPVLSVRILGGGQLTLSWRNPSTGYVLQQTASMSGQDGGWMDVTNAPVINGSNKEVTLTAAGGFCMFRLRQP